MDIHTDAWPDLGARLKAERQRLGLTREQLAAQGGLSQSFVRDAESHPERCTLGRLTRLCGLLGVALWSSGWQTPEPPPRPGTVPVA